MGVSLVLGSQTMGIIVGGPNGYGLGNATASGLQSDLDTRSLPAFLFWNNLLRVADSSGIYLGRNATTGRGWVMTAAHVTELFTGTDSITVMGQSYTVRDSRIIQHTDSTGTFNTDIRLYAIGGQSGDPALPALPAVPLLESEKSMAPIRLGSVPEASRMALIAAAYFSGMTFPLASRRSAWALLIAFAIAAFFVSTA